MSGPYTPLTPIGHLRGRTNSSGDLVVEASVSVSGSDGAIVDGVSSAIKATVLDLVDANPLTVAILDSNGDQISSFGGGTQYTEDAVAAANPVGTALILVREDARAGSLVSNDGDNVAARGNNKGELYIKHTDSIPTEQQLDYDTGAGTATLSLVGLALPASGGPVAGGTNTNPIQIGDAGGNISIDDGGNSITVDGSVTVTQGTASNLKAQVVGAGTAGTADAGVLTVQGIASMTKLLVTPDSVALPANQSVNAAQIGGTNTVSGGVAGTLAVGGNVATNVAIGTNPINNGAQAVSSENAAVTTGRMVQLVADLVGKLIVLPYSNPENFVSGAITSAMTGTTSTSLIAAPASGLRNYITQITVSNAHATVGTDVIIQDGSGGTTLYTIPAAAVYGGAVVTFPTPLKQPTTATAIYCANVTTGASTKVSASGYKGA
jgi:hypothetical protein